MVYILAAPSFDATVTLRAYCAPYEIGMVTVSEATFARESPLAGQVAHLMDWSTARYGDQGAAERPG